MVGGLSGTISAVGERQVGYYDAVQERTLACGLWLWPWPSVWYVLLEARIPTSHDRDVVVRDGKQGCRYGYGYSPFHQPYGVVPVNAAPLVVQVWASVSEARALLLSGDFQHC